MRNHNKISTAVKLALSGGASAGIVAALAISPTAQAQQVGPLEEIVVVGSRIRRADISSASPISVMNRDDMLQTGIRDVGQLLQSMPAMSGSPIGTTTNNGGNGDVEIDLRGLGVDRTVTLVNGNRMVQDDFQTVPPILIERVEILKDGASAIYGADAVAGVVNIVTRTDFEGISVELQNADYFDTDSGAQNSISLIAGTTFTGGNFIFGAEYVDQEEIYQRDTPWALFATDYYLYPAGCEAHVTAPYTGYPDGGCYPAGSSRIPEGRLGFYSGDYYINEGNGLVPDDGRSYNYAPVNYIQTPFKRMNFFADANFDVADNIRFSTTIRGNLRTSSQELAPLPYDTRPGFDPGYHGSFNGEPYNGVSEDNYYLVQAVTAAGLPIEPVVDARRRMIETNRRMAQDVQSFEAVMRLQGTFGDNIDWDAYYNTGRRQRTDNDFGQFGGVPLGNALGPSADLDGNGIPECYRDINDPSTIIEGCVPFNLFGGPYSVTPEMLQYVATGLIDNRLTEQSIAGFSLTGSSFDLPGGPLGWAFGANYWDQSFTYSPDSAKQQNAVTGSVGLGTYGTLYSSGVFGEIFAPVFDNGTQSLDLKVGIRYDDYNLFGGEATGQLGIEFQATDSVKLRATYGTVFRAPTLEDLYEGLRDDAPTAVDPCWTPLPGETLPAGCAQDAGPRPSGGSFQVPAKIGGNANLSPETGDTMTAGVVWTPDLSSGDLSLTLDYWSADIDDGISSLGVQYILDDCYISQNAASCALITRVGSNYGIARIVDAPLNVAKQTAEGVDLEMRYGFDTRVGRFQANFFLTHLLERQKVPYAGATTEDLVGTYTTITAEDGGAYAEDKINYSLQWYRDNLSISYLGEYISDLDTHTLTFSDFLPAGYVQHTDSILYHDIVLNYDFGTGSQLAFGLTNITDEEPPFLDQGFNSKTDPSTYRMFGRGYYLRFTQDF